MDIVRKTICQCLYERAVSDADHIALEMDDWKCTYHQLDEMTNVAAGQMRSIGIKKGTNVGIWSVNNPNWVMTFLAAQKIGAVPVLINTCYRQDEVKGILNYSDVEVLYYGEGYKTIRYKEVIDAICEETPKVRHFIQMDEFGENGWCPKEENGSERAAETAAVTKEETDALVGPDDIACIIFTSGTTSLPKGVMLSHYNLVNNAICTVESMHWNKTDKACVTTPLFHTFGVTDGIVSGIVAGMTNHLIPYFKTVKVWEAIEEYHCTVLNGVPSMFLALTRRPGYENVRAEGLKSGVIAGSPLTVEEYWEICERFPALHLQPSYGQTETSPCVTIADWEQSNEEKAGSAGKVIEHIEVRLMNNSTGTVVSMGPDSELPVHGVDGEIQVKGYNVMQGYYKLPDATKQAFTEDGWLKTGDVGRFNEKWDLFITGRIKEIIIRAGENIFPGEIATVIQELPWVREAKVVGVPAPVVQEEIMACIVVEPDYLDKIDSPEAEDLKDEVRNYVRTKLAHYKVPAFVMLMKEFPMNASGKIHLKVLKDMAEEEAKRIQPKK